MAASARCSKKKIGIGFFIGRVQLFCCFEFKKVSRFVRWETFSNQEEFIINHMHTVIESWNRISSLDGSRYQHKIQFILYSVFTELFFCNQSTVVFLRYGSVVPAIPLQLLLYRARFKSNPGPIWPCLGVHQTNQKLTQLGMYRCNNWYVLQ